MLDAAYPVVLFLHFLVIIIAAGMAALMHQALVRIRRATRAPQALEGAGVLRRLGPRMPLVALGLFVTGALLTSARWHWGEPFVATGIVGLFMMQLLSVAVLKPRLQQLGVRLARAGDAAIDADLATVTRDQVLWTVSPMQPAIAIGIMFAMVVKPSIVGSIAAVLVPVALVVLATARRAEQRELVTDPAGD